MELSKSDLKVAAKELEHAICGIIDLELSDKSYLEELKRIHEKITTIINQ